MSQQYGGHELQLPVRDGNPSAATTECRTITNRHEFAIFEHSVFFYKKHMRQQKEALLSRIDRPLLGRYAEGYETDIDLDARSEQEAIRVDL